MVQVALREVNADLESVYHIVRHKVYKVACAIQVCLLFVMFNLPNVFNTIYFHIEFLFTVGDACKRCCRMSLNETCFPIDPQDILPDGTPCIQGFCNKVILFQRY